MIVQAAPLLAPDEAARRAATGRCACLDLFARRGWGAAGDIGIAFDVVAADPVSIVGGIDAPSDSASPAPSLAASLDQLEQAWHAARRAWSPRGGPPPPEVPIGVGWLGYDLARPWSPGEHGCVPVAIGPSSSFASTTPIWIRDAGRAEARIVRLRRGGSRPPGRAGWPSLVAVATAAAGAAAGAGRRSRSQGRHAAAVARIKDYLRRRRCLSGQPGAAADRRDQRRRSPLDGGHPSRTRPCAARRLDGQPGRQRRHRSLSGGQFAGTFSARHSGRRAVETRPIKGTRPRGVDAASDAAAHTALAASDKGSRRTRHDRRSGAQRPRAGLSDGERGGRRTSCASSSCRPCSIWSPRSRGRLRPDVGLAELLRATFPGGSVTGAPKRRAMEIIEELESVRRGIYTGATGWLGAAGDLDLAVAIRTATVRGAGDVAVGRRGHRRRFGPRR